ncbi:sigma-70 family RNA polymerase sigma factor [Natronosporangium hydrolyticum]|uniref:sigma-70 family RNA polymerase sigma factor n=1 Tax=Natronosporangium hydrolyticum TaxID=2811111 RepID=UPI001EFA1F40|nr:sigma-70 family RNA polymerase sigma factor [Natronosporangium hydrolyticum]
MDQEIDKLAELADPTTRAKEAGDLLVRHQQIVGELSRIRREALEELAAQGMTQTQIAELLGTTRARIGQILSSGPRPERALLGFGTLTVALGGKIEGDKQNPGPVVAQEDFVAYENLRDLAQTVGLSTRYEVISAGGALNVNREGLIVICGPRLSSMIAQILASDPHLAFEEDDSGWYLVDKQAGRIYRSPIDDGQSADYAYLGRLPRLDGRGSFLYIAGIHAAGAAGVIHYLANNLADLYREVKKRRFSTLIACTFDPKTREVESSEMLTPIYRPDGA